MASLGPDLEASPMACIRCLEIAERWLTVCSATTCVRMTEAFQNFSDEALADLCILRWGLDQPQGDDNDLTWFESHGACRGLLVWAFATQRVFATQGESS